MTATELESTVAQYTGNQGNVIGSPSMLSASQGALIDVISKLVDLATTLRVNPKTMPTSDPHESNLVWLDGDLLRVSAG